MLRTPKLGIRIPGLIAVLVLAAGACSGGGELPPQGTTPDDPCAVGPVFEQPIPITPPGLRPDAFDASSLQTRWPIKHVVFIVKENRTFDNFFGVFPGANGTTTGKVDGRTVPLTKCIKQRLPQDLLHNYPTALRSWNDGKMDGFAISPFARENAYSEARPSDIPNYWHWAQNFVLGDNFFASAMGPSFPNHLFTIAASSAGTHDNPVNAIQSIARRQEKGLAKTWGCDSAPSAYVIVEGPDGEKSKVFPCLELQTEADLLNKARIPWAYYGAPPSEQGYIWQAFDAIKHIRRTSQWEQHVFNVEQVVPDIQDGRLPPVTWITPEFWLSDHPDVGLCNSENWTTQVVNAIMQSDMWKDTAIFISWDDWGGFYDHVPPPQVDKFGMGFRVPLLVISPYAKKGYIDSELGEFSSVLRFVEDNWGLTQLTHRDRDANNLTQNFDFTQDPRPPDPLPMRHDCQQQPGHRQPPPGYAVPNTGG